MPTDVSSLRRTRRRWTLLAPLYECRVRLFLRWRGPAVDALHLRPGDTILDLACGTGLNFSHVMKRSGAEGRIVGVDCTRAMLERAGRKATRHGWTGVRLIEGDAAHLPLASASCDAVLCSYAMAIIPDYRGALDEAARVLRPGGRLVLLEPKVGSTLWGLTATPLVAFAGWFSGVDLWRRPWEELPRLLADVSFREYAGGIVYIASGSKRETDPHAEGRTP